MNKKGFTLIELLAVIVVLGLVLVVTIPSIATSINNNKLSALNTLSKEVAKWYNEKVLEDKLSNKKESPQIKEDTWYCLNDVNGTNIASSYGLNTEDIVLKNEEENKKEFIYISFDGDGLVHEKPIRCSISRCCKLSCSCSAIRIVNGSAEVLLIGKEDGKYGKNNTISYSVSTAKKGYFYG